MTAPEWFKPYFSSHWHTVDQLEHNRRTTCGHWTLPPDATTADRPPAGARTCPVCARVAARKEAK